MISSSFSTQAYSICSPQFIEMLVKGTVYSRVVEICLSIYQKGLGLTAAINVLKHES